MTNLVINLVFLLLNNVLCSSILNEFLILRSCFFNNQQHSAASTNYFNELHEYFNKQGSLSIEQELTVASYKNSLYSLVFSAVGNKSASLHITLQINKIHQELLKEFSLFAVYNQQCINNHFDIFQYVSKNVCDYCCYQIMSLYSLDTCFELTKHKNVLQEFGRFYKRSLLLALYDFAHYKQNDKECIIFDEYGSFFTSATCQRVSYVS